MGFRIGWWAKKWFGITWGPKGGFRVYGMFGGRRGKSRCLLPFAVLVTSGVFLLVVGFRICF